jgi:hypothetical protein
MQQIRIEQLNALPYSHMPYGLLLW